MCTVQRGSSASTDTRGERAAPHATHLPKRVGACHVQPSATSGTARAPSPAQRRPASASAERRTSSAICSQRTPRHHQTPPDNTRHRQTPPDTTRQQRYRRATPDTARHRQTSPPPPDTTVPPQTGHQTNRTPDNTRHRQTPPDTTKRHQTPPDNTTTTRHHQSPPDTARHHQAQPDTTRYNHIPPVTTRHHQTTPATTRQTPPDTTRQHHRQTLPDTIATLGVDPHTPIHPLEPGNYIESQISTHPASSTCTLSASHHTQTLHPNPAPKPYTQNPHHSALYPRIPICSRFSKTIEQGI